MFIGHFAVGFGAKKPAPAVSLGTLFLAAQFLDLLWPVLILLGIERVRIVPGLMPVNPLDFVSYPWSHSLAAALVWSLLFAGIYWMLRRRALASAILGAAVFSHWILDFVTHRPDLQLWGGSETRVGLGLWYSPLATFVVEIALFTVGIRLYANATRPRDRTGRWAFAGLVVFLLLTYGASMFGPPPPNEQAIGWAGLSMWLLVLWGYWVDRHREAVPRRS